MLRSVNDLRGFGIRAMDGVTGEVVDLYFDDRDWVVRHIVVETDGWSSSHVLISPDAITASAWTTHVLPASLTRADVEESPDAGTSKPVSQQLTDDWLSDSHLRSARAVIGHHVGASDGNIGHVEDLVIDDETWAIRYLIVNTSNWFTGRRVLISPRQVETVSWLEAKVFVDMSRQAVKRAPLSDSEPNFASPSKDR